jgi:ubiquinone biosynthesis protein
MRPGPFRLREIIQSLGGTAVKIGQQLAMRIDLMPYVYGAELSKLFDEVPAFPTEQAIERIEALLGQPINKVFAAFDSKPNRSCLCRLCISGHPQER